MFFDEFDRIYVINLRSRSDRRQEMELEFRKLGLEGDERIVFFDAIACDDAGPFKRVGSLGAFLSHLAILEMHRDTQYTLLILQDDCEFVPIVGRVQSSGWDILYGGYTASDPSDLINSDIIGAHCMGFRSTVLPSLVTFLRAVYSGQHRPPGIPLHAPAAPIDGSLVWYRRSHPEVRTVFQKVAFQRSSKTDIGDPSAIDRFPTAARLLRRGLRAVRRTTGYRT
jgi:glycosyl transferase family 25